MTCIVLSDTHARGAIPLECIPTTTKGRQTWPTRPPSTPTGSGARPTPQAKAFGRIPKNRPLGGFLDGIPPHRFEPRSVPEKREEKIEPLSRIRPKGSERKPGAADCPAAWPSVLRYAPSHAQGQDGVPGFRAASGRLKRKSAVRQNGAIKTGADIRGSWTRFARPYPSG